MIRCPFSRSLSHCRSTGSLFSVVHRRGVTCSPFPIVICGRSSLKLDYGLRRVHGSFVSRLRFTKGKF